MGNSAPEVPAKTPEVEKREPQVTDEERARLIRSHREDIRTLANGQKFLLIGGDGHGKSSLINTVNHAVRLEKPNARFQEIAEIGSGASTCTMTFTSYTAEKGLFKDVTCMKEDQKPQFFDVIGMSENDRVAALTLIPKLAMGEISEDLDLRTVKKGDSKATFSSDVNEKLKCWSIIFVQSAAHELVEKVANSLRTTVETFKANRMNIRVFFVATNIDQCKDEDTLKGLLEEGAFALNVPHQRTFQISNYTCPADIGRDWRTKPNLKKEEEALQLFVSLLQESNKPAHAS